MKLNIEIEQEVNGRWLAEIPDLASVMAYGVNEHDAIAKAEALALRVLAERFEHNESAPI